MRPFAFDRALVNLKRAVMRQWFYLHQATKLKVVVRDDEDRRSYRFLAESLETYTRTKDLLTKEVGTIAWLRENLSPDDIFLDIGANIGLFTIFAAARLSGGGHVYACEPHLPSAAKLLENLLANDLAEKVTLISAAVAPKKGFAPFQYKRIRQGASGSQLSLNDAELGYRKVATELKYAISVDEIVEEGTIPPPNLVKIDTDGLELPILTGMSNLLKGSKRPRSIQVEVQIGERQPLLDFMLDHGYSLARHHFSARAQSKIDGGAAPDQVIHNAIFELATGR